MEAVVLAPCLQENSLEVMLARVKANKKFVIKALFSVVVFSVSDHSP
jgi:hypothetical protein